MNTMNVIRLFSSKNSKISRVYHVMADKSFTEEEKELYEKMSVDEFKEYAKQNGWRVIENPE